MLECSCRWRNTPRLEYIHKFHASLGFIVISIFINMTKSGLNRIEMLFCLKCSWNIRFAHSYCHSLKILNWDLILFFCFRIYCNRVYKNLLLINVCTELMLVFLLSLLLWLFRKIITETSKNIYNNSLTLNRALWIFPNYQKIFFHKEYLAKQTSHIAADFVK